MRFFRFFNNIRIKLLLTYLILIIFNISLMGYLFYYFTKAHFMSGRKDYLVTSADFFIKSVSPNVKSPEDLLPAIRFFMRQYWDHMDYDLIVVDVNSNIISGSSGIDSIVGSSSLPSNYVDNDPRTASVLQSGKPLSWIENTASMPYIYYCSPIFLENKVIGAVKLTMSTEDFGAMFDVLRSYFFTTFIWSLIAAALIALIFVRTMLNPIVKVRDMAMEITKGNFKNRLKNYSNDEIGDLSRDINKMADELQKLEKTRNSFLANVSHELRTPLTIIKGFAVTLLSGSELNPSDKHCLEMIDKEADRLTRLVNELLELSRIKTGRFSLNLSDCNIIDLIDFVTFQLSPKAEELGCEIIVEETSSIPLIKLDPDKIKEILINLLDNALKYSVSAKGESKVYVSCRLENNFIKIIVRDTGPGIPQKELENIFERFFRGDSRSQKVEGVGLGLAIVREIVNAHGGKIYARNCEDKGCEFIIELPVSVHNQA